MAEEKERNLYTHVCFASIASGISLILSLVVMLRYNYRSNLEMDYLGSIVAILSFAVAVFVGVQIYQSFVKHVDNMNIRDKIKRILDYINLNTFLYLFFICIGLFNLYYLTKIYPRSGENLSFDYMGIIVGILSLLVGFLVAWQIYKTIEVDKKIEAMNNSSKDAIMDDIFYNSYMKMMSAEYHSYHILKAGLKSCIPALNSNFSEEKAETLTSVVELYSANIHELYQIDSVKEEIDKISFKSKSINECYKIIKQRKNEIIKEKERNKQ